MYLVEDVMTPHVVTLKPDDDVALAETMIALGRFRHLPVVGPEGILVGLVTHSDLQRARLERGRTRMTTADVMRVDVVTTTAKASLPRALTTMMHNRFGCLPVVSAAGVLEGIVTQFDLVRFAASFTRELDEIERLACE